jgi:hypothetical protein
MAKTEIAAKRYDSLLYLFTSENTRRPNISQPNRVGDKTYATDGRAMLIIPNNLLGEEYGCHERVPNYQAVFSQQTPMEPVRVKLKDVADILLKFKKLLDMSDCEDCEGQGQCPHCQKECDTCGGTGQTEDRYKPKVYAKEEQAVRICDKLVSPYMMDLLSRVVRSFELDSFLIVSAGLNSLHFEIGPTQLLISGLPQDRNEDVEHLIFDLKPQ